MGKIGLPEILLIAVVVLVLFGGRKIPDFFKNIGTGIKEFKNAMKDEQPGDKKNEQSE